MGLDKEKYAIQSDSLEGRLAYVVKTLGGAAQASKICGKSDETVRRYVAGKSEPSFPAIAKLASKAKVSLNWLATGEGSMERIDQAVADPRLEDDRIVAGAVILTLSQIMKMGRVPPPALTRGLFLDNLEVTATAGAHDDTDRMLERIISSVQL